MASVERRTALHSSPALDVPAGRRSHSLTRAFVTDAQGQRPARFVHSSHLIGVPRAVLFRLRNERGGEQVSSTMSAVSLQSRCTGGNSTTNLSGVDAACASTVDAHGDVKRPLFLVQTRRFHDRSRSRRSQMVLSSTVASRACVAGRRPRRTHAKDERGERDGIITRPDRCGPSAQGSVD